MKSIEETLISNFVRFMEFLNHVKRYQPPVPGSLVGRSWSLCIIFNLGVWDISTSSLMGSGVCDSGGLGVCLSGGLGCVTQEIWGGGGCLSGGLGYM